MWCDLLHYLNAKGFPEQAFGRLRRQERFGLLAGVVKLLGAGTGKKAGLGTIQTLSAASTDQFGLGAKEVLGAAPKLARTGARQAARCGGVPKRQSERCSKAARMLNLSENPGRKP
jgi:hypothetical protein